MLHALILSFILFLPMLLADSQAQPMVPPIHASFGTATIDGILEPDEWAAAGKTDFYLTKAGEGKVVPATLYTMNDSHNLYAALVVETDQANFSEIATLYLDSDANHAINDGDDALKLSRTFSLPVGAFVTRFTDSYGEFCEQNRCAHQRPDVEDGGNNDGAGAIVHGEQTIVFEWAHPLMSLDIPHDAQLALGQLVQLTGEVEILANPNDAPTISGTLPNITLVVMPFQVELVSIGSVNGHRTTEQTPQSQRQYRKIAIFSTDSFAAPSSVNWDSLTFGRTGQEQSVRKIWTRDVDKDGRLDLVLQIDQELAGFQDGNNLGILLGNTHDATVIIGFMLFQQ